MSIKQGEAAPFAGDLFPPELSLRLGLGFEHCQEMKAADATRLVRLHEIELTADRDKEAIRKEADASRLAAMQRALDRSSVFYREPWFVATVTVAVTVAAVVLSVYAYGEIARSLPR